MKLGILDLSKFGILSSNDLKAVNGGAINNTGPGSKRTGKTKVENGITYYETQHYTSDTVVKTGNPEDPYAYTYSGVTISWDTI